MFKLVAVKILALFSLTLKTPSNIELPRDSDWIKINVKNSHQSFTLDTWENRSLIDQCKKNPDSFIFIPPVYVSNQELWDERNLIESIGDIRKDLLESGNPSKSIPCMKVLKSKKLIWNVYRISPVYSKIKDFPSIKPQKVLPNSLVFFTCSLILIGLGLFATIVFRHKITSKVLFNYVGSCVCLSIYGLLCCSTLWISGLIFHKNAFLIILFKVLGIHFLSSFLYLQRYIPKTLHFYSTFSVIIIILDSFLLYDEPNLFFTYYRILCFPYFLIFICYYFLNTLLKVAKNKNIENLLILIAASILLLSAINDILNFFVLIKSNFLGPAALLIVLIAHLYFFKNEVGTVILQRDSYKKRLEKAYQEKLEIIGKNTVAHSIANTVQRIAHDIKKPFHMIKLTFNELKAGHIDLQQTFALAAHVEKSLVYVDNLLTDLMSASRDKPNKLEPLELEQLIDSSWSQANLNNDRVLKLELDLRHSSKLFVDKLKVQRLFINLFNNGKEAMGSQGKKMWVKTLETTINERPYAEITVGNEDSFIAKKDRSKIFSPYFTSGKKNGTGLGLAICYETVVSHGGQIRCESNNEKNTEFIFTLPSLEEKKSV